jgi:transposase
MQMDKEQYGRAKASLIFSMQEGHSWQTAAASAGLQVSQSNAYRLWRAFRQHGETALSDGRHGHPSKLCGAVRAFLARTVPASSSNPSSTIQMELQEHFDLSVSISQLNRVRAALGVSNHSKYTEPGKKRWERETRSLNQSGKKARLVSCYLPRLIRQACSQSFKHHFPHVSSELPVPFVSLTVSLRLYVVSC